MRVAIVLLCLGLAACAGTDAAIDAIATPVPAATPTAAPADPAAQPAAAPATQPAPAPSRRARANPAGRNTTGPAIPDEKTQDAADDGPMTREKASGQCWMRAEANRRDASIDARNEFVSKCVADTLKKHQAQ
jgi:hypothetical protein